VSAFPLKSPAPYCSMTMRPNAKLQARLEAGAQRTLYAGAW
jgi:hypothetical protein